MFLSIVLPCYNEEKILKLNILKIIKFFDQINIVYEIIIIDDCSRKNITSENKNLRIYRNKKNYGKGFSIRRGIKKSRGDWILFTDSDLSVSIDQFLNFKKFSDNYDIICGSRSIKNSLITKKQKIYRQILGKIFNKILKILRLTNLNDTQCGFKLLRKNKIELFIDKLSINRFAFDVELLAAAQINNLKIIDIPVVWENNNDSKLHIVKDSFIMLFEILIVFVKKIVSKY